MSAFGVKADIIRAKADIPLLMSGVGGKADSLAHLPACLLIAEGVEEVLCSARVAVIPFL